MISISLCMIVKNEERVLERCLQSLQGLMDEIIIVDTGSTDRTKEIAKKYTDKIYDFTWIDDFSAARNFSFSKATIPRIITIKNTDLNFISDFVSLLGTIRFMNVYRLSRLFMIVRLPFYTNRKIIMVPETLRHFNG